MKLRGFVRAYSGRVGRWKMVVAQDRCYLRAKDPMGAREGCSTHCKRLLVRLRDTEKKERGLLRVAKSKTNTMADAVGMSTTKSKLMNQG